MRRVLPLICVLSIAAPAAALGAGFDDPVDHDPSQQFTENNSQRRDTPNDPDYDSSEGDLSTTPAEQTTSLFAERFDLFGFPSRLTRLTAVYKEGPHTGLPQVSGFNAAGAWKVSRGDPRVSVAILDTGINWDNQGLRNRVKLNAGELPSVPDTDNVRGPSVDDYANQPKVVAVTGGTRPPTGQDLIRAYSDGTDADGNGYVDDIAGWDFFDNDNDPMDKSSYFAASNHGSGRTGEAIQEGNDGQGSIGVCPKCLFVPLRIWDTFVSDQNNFALAVTYAADNGVQVVEGADGGLYHSAFSEAASEYAYSKGVSQVYSGDDLNTANHNYPANYNHTMLIEGTVADVKGLGMELPSNSNDPGIRGGIARVLAAAGIGTNAFVQTYFRGANTTQFGGHSSISMEGTTGSANTGKAAGAVALVRAAALEKGTTLSADETRELLEQTAEDVLPLNTTGTGNPDPAQPGFDTHFGYGRADVGEAVKRATTGSGPAFQIPPEASIGSPDWYAPLTGSSARITGLANDRLRPGQEFTYTLEYGLGLAPSAWFPVNGGTSSSAVTDLGTLDLDAVRAKLAARLPSDHQDRDDPAGPTFDKTRTDPFEGQFTVRLVVRSKDSSALVGVDRKVLTALKDDTLKPGFPKRLGTGGEAPLRYSDLDGDNRQELVLPTEDGLVHAYRPDGTELEGWPVHTRVQLQAADHPQAPALKVLEPPREVPRAPTIADLNGDGRPEIITTAGERIYAWDAKGAELEGFPVRPDPDRANCAPSEQSKPRSHPKCGFLASPAVGHLEGADKPLDIVVPGLDGRLRAYRPDGTVVPNFPRQLIDPTVPANEKVVAESINSPAVGDLDGDGFDDVVVATNEVYGSSGGGNDVSFGGVLSQAGTTSRVYAVSGKTGDFLPGWPIKLGGVIQDVLPLVGPGHDAALVKIGGAQQVVVSTTGSTSISVYDAKGTLTREINQSAGPDEGALNLFESPVVGDVDGDGAPDVAKYQIDLGQAANLLLVGQNVPYSHRIGAFDAATGASKPGFPVITDDYQFLSSPTVAKVAAGASNQVLAGTGLGLLHAYDGLTGRDAPGFPKVTGGWLFAPAALSDDGRMAGITREGYLFEWAAPGAPGCQTEWPSFRHDQQGTGNYDGDGTPPAAAEDLSLTPVTGGTFRLGFRSPGDDGFCGTAKRYVADVDGIPLDLGAPVAGGTANSRDFTLPADARQITLRAQDERGNLGPPAALLRQSDGSFTPVTGQEIVDRPPVPGARPVSSTPSPMGSTPSPAGSMHGCSDRQAPRSVINRRATRIRRHVLRVRGHSRDRGCGKGGRGKVARVRIRVVRHVHGRCRYVTRRGHLSRRRSCRRPLLLHVKGRAHWRRALRLHVPRGRYRVVVRAVDTSGNRERKRRRASQKTVRVR